MRMYFFDVTVKVAHQDNQRKIVLYKGARARDELRARRILLERFLKDGFQVVRIDRVPERCARIGSEWE